ncbi:MAG: MBL fold metallo-hydrolase [Acidobacteria bacterium]|nr:MBL fold metallo-hydrolase [Acidobacteriota bacterium]
MATLEMHIPRSTEVEILMDGETVDARRLFMGDNVRLLVRAYPEAIRLFERIRDPDRLTAALRSSAEISRFYEISCSDGKVAILLRDSVFREAGPRSVDELTLSMRFEGHSLAMPLPLGRLRALGRLLPLLLKGCEAEAVENLLEERLEREGADWAMELFGRMQAAGLLAQGAPPVNRFDGGPRPGLTFLGHTGLVFQSHGGGVAIDPLLWRETGISPETFDVARTRLSALACTHAHWDHFFPAALLWFDKDLPIIVPKVIRPTAFDPPIAEPLRLLGFTDVREAEHWSPIRLGDIEFIPVPFHGEQDEPEAEIDHYTYVLRSDGFCVYGGVDCFQDTYGEMSGVLERVRNEYKPQVAALPVSRLTYEYRWGGVNGFSRYLDTDLLDKTFQYTAGPAEGAAWTRTLGVDWVVPYALFVMKRWMSHEHAQQFREELSRLGLEHKLYPLRPLDSFGPGDLARTLGSRLRRRLLLTLYSSAKIGRLIDRRLSKIRAYRGLRWVLRRVFPSSSVEHH